jgi:hypothetical protein
MPAVFLDPKSWRLPEKPDRPPRLEDTKPHQVNARSVHFLADRVDKTPRSPYLEVERA